MTLDWHEWHRAYDASDSPLARRLVIVQQGIRETLDTAPAGPIQVISMCAGEGRDLLGVLADHPRARDVRGRLVELDPELAAVARANAPAGIEVRRGDAGVASAYAGAVPADLVLVCGVFGNITDDDMMHTIATLPSLCAPGAVAIWTRHRRAPDMTGPVREQFAKAGFDELSFTAPEGTIFGVGMHKLTGPPAPFVEDATLFSFVGYAAMAEHCPQCGFSYAIERSEIIPWLRSDARAFVERFRALDGEAVRRRPQPEVWSPLEYACHVRDVLMIQRERVLLAQTEIEPKFAPMRRDERVVEQRYNEQDPDQVAGELAAAAESLATTFDGFDDAAWQRTGWYNFPEPMLRSVEWIGVHTVHELLHHRTDITARG